MIENRDAEGFASKRALDVAPRGALLFALPAAESVRVQVCLTRVALSHGIRTASPPTKNLPNVTFWFKRVRAYVQNLQGRRYGT